MGSFSITTRPDDIKTLFGVGVIVTAGVVMGLVELRHVRKMSSTLGATVFAFLPFVVNLGLVAAGALLYRSSFDGSDTVRVAGWVVLGMAVISLLAVWTVTHQNIRGRSFAHAPFVVVNNSSVGGLIGFMLGWYDVLRRQYRTRAETERARLEFLYSSLRHNILNGLNIVLGTVEVLEDRVDDTAQDHLDTIRDRGEEMTRFTEATNAFMENFLDQSDTSTRPVDLSDALDEELEAARNQYDHADFSLTVPEEMYVEGDDFVFELFSNLLSNAVVHNDKATPKVSVTADRADETVVVRVADNGPGIPDEQKERVLKWNIKGADSSGTGLGLAIADTIVERYDGALRIKDNEPEGTVLTVELPAASQKRVRSGPESAQTP